jgi:hypothetical protein
MYSTPPNLPNGSEAVSTKVAACPIAANTASAGPTKNNEQKIRRHRDGVNVRFGFSFFILLVSLSVLGFSDLCLR